MDFSVEYDPLTNTVRIDSAAPYQNSSSALKSKGAITLPTDGSQYIPHVGDRILCDDGTEYEIKDTTRWDTNVFAEGPLLPLPTPTCDWSAFPTLTLQPPIVKHYHDKYGDDLFVRNVYDALPVFQISCVLFLFCYNHFALNCATLPDSALPPKRSRGTMKAAQSLCHNRFQCLRGSMRALTAGSERCAAKWTGLGSGQPPTSGTGIYWVIACSLVAAPQRSLLLC